MSIDPLWSTDWFCNWSRLCWQALFDDGDAPSPWFSTWDAVRWWAALDIGEIDVSLQGVFFVPCPWRTLTWETKIEVDA